MIFRLDVGQITFNPVENAFATQQLAYVFRFFDFWNFFFAFPFSPFLFFFAAVIDLLLGLLAVKKTSEKASSRRAIFSMEQPGVVAGNFALSFSLNFLSIFEDISGSIRPITPIWAPLERSFPPAEVEYR